MIKHYASLTCGMRSYLRLINAVTFALNEKGNVQKRRHSNISFINDSNFKQAEHKTYLSSFRVNNLNYFSLSNFVQLRTLWTIIKYLQFCVHKNHTIISTFKKILFFIFSRPKIKNFNIFRKKKEEKRLPMYF